MPQSMQAIWKNSKTKFETITGRSKPVDKVLGIFRQTTGIEQALKACDKAEDAFRLNRDERNEVRFRQAVERLKRHSTAYLVRLQTEIKKAKPEMGSDADIYLKGLRYLKASLEDVRGHFEDRLAERPRDRDYAVALAGARTELRRARKGLADLRLKLAVHVKDRRARGVGADEGLGDALGDDMGLCGHFLESLGRELVDMDARRTQAGDAFPDIDLGQERARMYDLIVFLRTTDDPKVKDVAKTIKDANEIVKRLQGALA